MRKPALALSVLVMVLALAACNLARADDWQKDYTVTGTPQLRVDAKEANIEVTTWSRNQIHAHLITEGWRIGPQAVRISESQSGDNVEIDLHIPHYVCIGFCFKQLRLELEVPKNSNLDLRTGDGNISVSNLSGTVQLRSGDGDLSLSGVAGTLRAESGDGDMTLDSVSGTLQAQSGDGNVRVYGRFDALRIHTGDGNATARVEDGSKLAGNWSLRSGDGNIELRVPDDLSAQLDLRTDDGRITLDVPVTVSGQLSKRWVQGRLGQGGGLLAVETGDGSIRVSH